MIERFVEMFVVRLGEIGASRVKAPLEAARTASEFPEVRGGPPLDLLRDALA